MWKVVAVLLTKPEIAKGCAARVMVDQELRSYVVSHVRGHVRGHVAMRWEIM